MAEYSALQAAMDLVKQVGFPIATAGYFMWRDYRFVKEIEKYMTENNTMLKDALKKD